MLPIEICLPLEISQILQLQQPPPSPRHQQPEEDVVVVSFVEMEGAEQYLQLPLPPPPPQHQQDHGCSTVNYIEY